MKSRKEKTRNLEKSKRRNQKTIYSIEFNQGRLNLKKMKESLPDNAMVNKLNKD